MYDGLEAPAKQLLSSSKLPLASEIREKKCRQVTWTLSLRTQRKCLDRQQQRPKRVSEYDPLVWQHTYLERSKAIRRKLQLLTKVNVQENRLGIHTKE